MEAVVRAFVAETRKRLRQFESDLSVFTDQLENSECVARLIGTIRSIKGACGFIGLTDLGVLAHSIQNILGPLERGESLASSETLSVLYERLDELKWRLQGLDVCSPELGQLHFQPDAVPDDSAAVKAIRQQSPPCGAANGLRNFLFFVNPAADSNRVPAPMALRSFEATTTQETSAVLARQTCARIFVGSPNGPLSGVDGSSEHRRGEIDFHRTWFDTHHAANTNEDPGGASGTITRLLLFEVGQSRKMAVSLSHVTRLEEIPQRILEYRGNVAIASVRGHRLPLISLEPMKTDRNRDRQLAILFAETTNSFGLVVDRVDEIVEEPLLIRETSRQAGIAGHAVIGGEVREILDVGHFGKSARQASFQ